MALRVNTVGIFQTYFGDFSPTLSEEQGKFLFNMVEKINKEVPRQIIPTTTILLVFYRFAPLFTCNGFIKIFFSALYSVLLYGDFKLLLY